MTSNAGHFALVVGVDHYPDFRPLKGACNDARAFAQWLGHPDGGALPAANIACVLSSDPPPKPIHEEIDDALQALKRKVREATIGVEARRFYFYFSGHGLGIDNRSTALCLPRWSHERRMAALDFESYVRLIMGWGLFAETVFLLDCCRVRLISGGGLASSLASAAPGDETSKSRSFIAYAAEFTQAAWEGAIADDAGGEEVRGHFTTALIAALSGAAAEPSGGVTAARLKDYIETQTPLIARAKNQYQNAEVDNGLSALSNPVFGRARPTGTCEVVIHFAPTTHGEVVVEDGQLNELRRGDASSGPWRIAVRGPTRLAVRRPPDGPEISVRVGAESTEDLHVEF